MLGPQKHRRRVVQTVGAHDGAKLPHPQRRRLKSRKHLTTRGEPEPLLKALNDSKGRKEVGPGGFEEMPEANIARSVWDLVDRGGMALHRTWNTLDRTRNTFKGR